MLNISKHIKLFSPGFSLGIKPVLYSILIFVSHVLKAQENLVYNGDMEEHSDCPITFSDPFQNPKEIEKCVGWKAPTYGTSDYYNTCAIGTFVHVPTNSMGFQEPYNGNGYLGAGFTNYTGGAGDDGYNGIMWWEYVQGKLITPLEQGKTYKFSMEVSLAEAADLAISEIGVFFSSTPITSQNTKPLTVSPQVLFYNPDYFKDTVNWVHLETLYIAEGGEKYLTIGNFRDSITTDTLRVYDLEPIYPNPYFTYIYIDNVKLTDFTEDVDSFIDISNFFSPNDDGVNDFWYITTKEISVDTKVTILNRWGNVIYEAALNGFKWDGKDINGKDCSDGVYFYRIEKQNRTGFIHLIR